LYDWFNMANKKRRERMQNLYRVNLGRYKLTRRDILVIEKLLRIYADVYEKKHASNYGQSTNSPDVRRHMPRKYVDMNVIFNGQRADSIKFLPKDIRRSSNFEIRCDPGIWVKFRPFSTTIGGQVLYATGVELMVMKEVASKIEMYLRKANKSLINIYNA
jgi:hypothetical protein